MSIPTFNGGFEGLMNCFQLEVYRSKSPHLRGSAASMVRQYRGSARQCRINARQCRVNARQCRVNARQLRVKALSSS
jgi:hypothetical protein